MPTPANVARLVLELPKVTEGTSHGNRKPTTETGGPLGLPCRCGGIYLVVAWPADAG